jgi:hypothetical protein
MRDAVNMVKYQEEGEKWSLLIGVAPSKRNWRVQVNMPQSEPVLNTIHASAKRGTFCCDNLWITQSAARLRLDHTFRSGVRPKKKAPNDK